MSVMSEIERIKNAKSALKTSIENKDVEVGDGLINTYASKVDMISGDDSHNAFKVATIQERNALTGVENGDVCVVQQSSIGNMTEATSSNVENILLNPTVVLPSALQDFIYATFESTSHNVRLNIDGSSSSINIMIDDMSSGVYEQIQYTSQDGITYTTQYISEPTTYTFNEPVSWQDYGEQWNDTIGYFLQTGTINFEGIYEASVESDVVTWNYLDVGISSINSDILLNKKAYTNNGTITGTRDMNKYALKGYSLSFSEPTDYEAYPLWIKPYGALDSYIINTFDTYVSYDDTVVPPESISTVLDYSSSYIDHRTDILDRTNGYIYMIQYKNRNQGSGAAYVPYFYKVNASDGTKTSLTPPNISSSFCDSFIFGNDPDVLYILPISQSSNTTTKVFYKYTISTNTTTQLANLPNWISQRACMIYHNKSNSIFVQSDYNSSDPLYKYSIDNNSWTTVNVSNLTDAERAFRANRMINGRGCFQYIALGDYSTNDDIYACRNGRGSTGNFMYKETTDFFVPLNTYVNGTSTLYYYGPFIKDEFGTPITNSFSMGQYLYYLGGNKILSFDANDVFEFTLATINGLVVIDTLTPRPKELSLTLWKSDYISPGRLLYVDGNDFCVYGNFDNKYKLYKYTNVLNNSAVYTRSSACNLVFNVAYYPYSYDYKYQIGVLTPDLRIKDANILRYKYSPLYMNNLVEGVYRYNEDMNCYMPLVNHLFNWQNTSIESDLLYFEKVVNISGITVNDFSYTIKKSGTSVGTITFGTVSGVRKWQLTINDTSGGCVVSVVYTESETEAGMFNLTTATLNSTNVIVNGYGNMRLPYSITVDAVSYDSTNGEFLKYIDE